jgi:hypothetical protein
MMDPKNARALSWLAPGLSAVAARMEPKEAAQAAATLFSVMASPANKTIVPDLAKAVSASLADISPTTQRARAVPLTAVVGCLAGTGQPLTTLAFLPAAAQPLPCRLSTQQLVDLLKLPTCYGAARRGVLDHLGNRYQRRFADVWEFVHFARKQRLGLDFTRPAQRPEGMGAGGRP